MMQLSGFEAHPAPASEIETRKLMMIAIEYDEADKLPLRWAIYTDAAAEPFLKAKRSFKT